MGTDALEGKVGRIYMPKQDVDNIALRKMKVSNLAAAVCHVSGALRPCFWCMLYVTTPPKR